MARPLILITGIVFLAIGLYVTIFLVGNLMMFGGASISLEGGGSMPLINILNFFTVMAIAMDIGGALLLIEGIKAN